MMITNTYANDKTIYSDTKQMPRTNLANNV